MLEERPPDPAGAHLHLIISAKTLFPAKVTFAVARVGDFSLSSWRHHPPQNKVGIGGNPWGLGGF